MEEKRAKDFIVLKTWQGKSLGTTQEYHQLVRCPDCGHEFIQDISSGCFHHRKTPWACPKCNYPWNYYNKLREKIYGKEKKEEPFNPSKRFVPDVSESLEEV